MKRTREEKAITLIALIITIVVLLILAVVAINAVTGDGIIQHATNAKTEYEKAQAEEQDMLSYYESYLGESIGKWTQSGNILKKANSDGTVIEFKIGDKIVYDEGTGNTTNVASNFEMKNLEWRVLGVNKQGELELISTQPTDSQLTLIGQQGWLEAEEKLDTLCDDLYGKGEGAQSARSLKAEDVDKLAGITTEEKKKECWEEYGHIYQYRYSEITQKIQYRYSSDKKVTWGPSESNEGWTDTAYSTFSWPEKETLSSSNYKDENNQYKIIELINKRYDYDLSKISLKTSDNISIASLLLKGLNNENNGLGENNITQWLASRNFNCTENTPYLTIHRIYGLSTGEEMMTAVSIYFSNGDYRERSYCVRPVVTLKLDAQFVDTNNDGILEVKE